MAGRIAYYGNIVKDGLILHLDAGKLDSYPRSGTTWTDLSGYGNNGTLTNGPVFNRSNGDSILFDGTDDYVSTNSIFCNSNGGTTICYWIQCSSFSAVAGAGSIFQDNYITSTCWNGTFDTLFYNVAKKQLTTPLSLNTFYHIAIDTTNYLIYVNGAVATTQNVAYGWATDAVSPRLGKNRYNSFAGKMYAFSVYNRVLTAAEILKNYNATKGRYI